MSARRPPGLVGLETEYAIRFSARPGSRRPGNDVIYEALIRAVGERVTLRHAGGFAEVQRRRFCENGGSFAYEYLPWCEGGGLIEGATPECVGAATAVRYQRAQDLVLGEAVPRAEAILAEGGFSGTLRLVKNCRDDQGHVYGAQENYEAEIAPGLWRVVWWLGLVLILPLLLLVAAAQAVFLLVMVAGYVGCAIAAAARGRVMPDQDTRRLEGITRVLYSPLTVPFLLLVRAVAFRRVRRALAVFLASRPIVTGAGTLLDDGRFVLSEKAPTLTSLIRTRIDPSQRSVFEVGNLVKGVLRAMMQPDLRGWRRLFRARQRLQIGFADSNLCETAEAVRVGTTELLVRMAEDGALDDAPVVDAVAALHVWTSDPMMRATVPGVGTALDAQRWYLTRAERWLAEHPTPPLDDVQIVMIWRTLLDDLARQPSSTVGRLDWTTKRWLLERSGSATDHLVNRRIDIGYHELGTGFFARLDEVLHTPRLFDPAAVHRAVREPPEAGPARLRGEAVRRWLDDTGARIDWDAVRVGPPLLGRVFRFDRNRRRDR